MVEADHVPTSTPAPISTPTPVARPVTTPLSEQVAVVTVKLKALNPLSVAQVRGEAARWQTSKGQILRLIDGFGNVLIDPTLRIRVNAQKFAQSLREKNLSDGRVGEEVPS